MEVARDGAVVEVNAGEWQEGMGDQLLPNNILTHNPNFISLGFGTSASLWLSCSHTSSQLHVKV